MYWSSWPLLDVLHFLVTPYAQRAIPLVAPATGDIFRNSEIQNLQKPNRVHRSVAPTTPHHVALKTELKARSAGSDVGCGGNINIEAQTFTSQNSRHIFVSM